MFALYLHSETCLTSKDPDQITFVGQSYPHYCSIRTRLDKEIGQLHPALDLRIADFDRFSTVHLTTYLAKIERLAAEEKVSDLKLGMECTGLEHCLPGYRAGLGGMLAAVDAMDAGQLSAAYVFSLGGHHSYPDWGHGYCLLNPQAAAVRYAQTLGFKRVLIIDWDIHHGDGTQAIFANDPSVHCLSIHSALDLYMSTMRVLKEGTVGAGKRAGHTNIPLADSFFSDQDVVEIGYEGRFYRAAESLGIFDKTLNTLTFKPDLITIFSGYDSHRLDCGGPITGWDEGAFEWLTECVMNFGRRYNAPILSIHGGGYQPEVTLRSAIAHVKTLSEYTIIG